MANDIWSIILNLVAAFIYSVLFWLWKNRGQKPQDIPQESNTWGRTKLTSLNIAFIGQYRP